MPPSLHARAISPWLIAAAAILFSTATLSAQDTGVVQGTITRTDDGAQLIGVIVSISGTSLSVSTGPEGRYTLRGLAPGPHTLQVRSIGYAPQDVSIQAEAGNVLRV